MRVVGKWCQCALVLLWPRLHHNFILGLYYLNSVVSQSGRCCGLMVCVSDLRTVGKEFKGES